MHYQNLLHPSAGPLADLDDLPGPRGLPVIGNLLQIDKPRFHLQLEKWAKQFGPLYKLRMGPQRIVILSNSEIISQLLKQRPDSFSRTHKLKIVSQEMMLDPGLFSSEGDTWRVQRRMVMSGFDPAHVKGYFPNLQIVAQQLAKRWGTAAKNKVRIDLQRDLMRYTVDTIAGLAFGVSVNTLSNEEDVIQSHLDRIFPKLFNRLMTLFPYWRYFKLPSDRELDRSIVFIKEAIRCFIQQARQALAEQPELRHNPSNLLQAMLLANELESSGVDDSLVAGNVMTMLLAGEDTTANTIAWLTYLLWRNPASLERARNEILEIVSNVKRPSYDELNQLEYLEACILETMRLKPVAPQLPLEALHDTQIGQVRIPKGTMIINLLRSESVDPNRVANANVFEPKRWQQEGSKLKKISMPFGAGPRMCPGRYLAMIEIKMAMVVLVGQFEITYVGSANGQEPEEVLSFTMMPKDIEMRLKLRT
jgi:cytochrome P450